MNFDLEDEALRLAKKAMLEKHSVGEFIPGVTSVPVTGKVFGQEEI